MHSMPSTRKPVNAKKPTDWEPLHAVLGTIFAIILIVAIAAIIIGVTSLLVMWMVAILTAGAFTITFFQSVAAVMLALLLGGLIGRAR